MSEIRFFTYYFSAVPSASININSFNNTIQVTVPTGTDISSLVADFTTNATDVLVSGNPQVSGFTSNNFVSPVIYTLMQDGKSVSVTVTIQFPYLVSIQVSPSTMNLSVERYRQFSAIGIYSDSSTVDLTYSANWTSSNASICYVDSSGMVFPYMKGNVSITASYSGISSSSSTVSIIEEFCVSVSGNDVSGDGCPDNPYFTIMNAIAEASLYGISGIRIAGGTYNESIEMLEGISLYGGYNADFQTRDFRNNISEVKAEPAMSYAVHAGVSTSYATVIDGLKITGPESPSLTYGVYISDNSGITITNCDINGNGNATTTDSYGIETYNAWDVVVRNSRIFGGNGQTSCGISIHYYFAYTAGRIENNHIHAGNGTINSYGIKYAFDSYSTVPIRNNSINAGSSLNSVGIWLDNSSSIIENNLIFSESGSSIGIYEANQLATPSSLRNNNIFNCGILYREVDSTSDFLTITSLESDLINEFMTASGNINLNILTSMAGTPYRSITVSTPVSVKTGGIDGGKEGWGFNDDINGNTRTGNGSTGWSMGPEEVN